MIKTSPKEEVLIARCKKGDQDSLREFSVTYGSALYQFLFSCLGDRPEEIKKILKLIFENIIPDLKLFQGQEPLRPLLFREALTKLSERAGEIQFKALPLTEPRKFRLLFEGLSFLDLPERILVLLRTQQDFTYSEIGWMLGCPSEEARMRVFKAQMRFGDILHTQVLAVEE